LLLGADSGFDSAAIFATLAAARVSVVPDWWLVKWNPRGFDAAPLHQRLAAEPATVWMSTRAG
jgi:hypothetical protein